MVSIRIIVSTTIATSRGGYTLTILAVAVFADEPTSGLDSTTALRLMHTLRSLASGGRTILTSIHQPSSRLYKQMDKVGRVLLLFGAHTAAGECPLTSIVHGCNTYVYCCTAQGASGDSWLAHEHVHACVGGLLPQLHVCTAHTAHLVCMLPVCCCPAPVAAAAL